MQQFFTQLKELKQELNTLKPVPDSKQLSDIYSHYAIITRSISSENELWKIDLWSDIAPLDEIKVDIEQFRFEKAKEQLSKDIDSLIERIKPKLHN